MVTGENRRAWTLLREGGKWEIYGGWAGRPPGVTVKVGPAAAWRLFYNALPRSVAPAVIAVAGEERLAEPLLRVRSVMV